MTHEASDENTPSEVNAEPEYTAELPDANQITVYSDVEDSLAPPMQDQQ